ncbi:NADH-quinone oxidoreductase subunit N [Buchnera aphidicola]|uniref:NADH-quinone oxidoreductase subunit N n=1 Tax=Buchnera aphidicola str. USDA (Myzus persicae) TaxID=1009856 RepID=W0P4C9_BUCMP|nr:NADH-quinone oxidoreductase subunit N [Buchnera aphidicola]AHG60205.1 Nuon [Buchnera aphidicola str. USDA (Myzus persicae)]AHG60783.1 Nuon [Buchnera aphidicola str. W106 (Myzus persicae)]AHG61355.1 Nuon [Buchnera aphidicola str. G002 (Myzus persicae)]AHG61928.1 Nuon [Buchnera aphidicola str. F009 (Myzus persicae)]WAI03106.1 MAG: NADH-quinone oxidoreductase subunit N [Buchnera aphidicola (Myzus persicae)]
MIKNLQQFIALLPFLIILVTLVTVILSISYNRNHFFVSGLSILGFISALFSLYFLTTVIPIDITGLLHVDGYSIFYIGMILIASISTCIFAYPCLLKYEFNKEEFYLLILMSTLGAVLLVISNHIASFFINIELMSLPVFGLIGYFSYKKKSLEALFKYLILSGVASSFLLMGIAWVYSISGSLSFISVNRIFNVVSLNEKLIVLFGISMIFLSLFFKLSVVPFHLWTPDIYQGTSALVLSFFSTVGKISIFCLLLNISSDIIISNNRTLYFIISLVTFFSMILGNLMALFQENLKRFLGYTSISQIGYLFVVLLTSENNYIFSLEANSIYLFSYLFSNIAFFGIMNLIANACENNNGNLISSYQGLFWSQPILSSILTLVLLSLAGIPMTLGFISKFYILSIIIQEHLWILCFGFLIATLLGFYCYLRIIINLYLTPSLPLQHNFKISNYWVYTPSGILILFSAIILLFLGLYPNPLISLVKVPELFKY